MKITGDPTDVNLSTLESTLVSFLNKDHKRTIQTASRLHPTNPEMEHALQCYVVVHRLPKLTLRASSFVRLFPDLYPKLANAWAPSPSADVKITAPPEVLTTAFGSGDPALFTAANSVIWWKFLCAVAQDLLNFVKGPDYNIKEIVYTCTLAQDLIKFTPSSLTPSSLWASHSLDLPTVLVPQVNEGSEEWEKIEDEEMRDGNVTDASDSLSGNGIWWVCRSEETRPA
ncbi:hypothetical protein DFH08DRAFT_946635 [Mycena albidolilacea]|uniref:Uncharacterized protein n=1 Tax=Mycena albidolilacea TaxID=1033008 RepID=A0AAD7ATH6_9AGAR|nr:hypothetical protein DFH08DRAFT_946635 [Mycena albidolilacea]